MKINALSFCLYSHSKKKLKHVNMHMQEATLNLLGLVLHVPMFAALTSLNCSHFHPVKVVDKFLLSEISVKVLDTDFYFCYISGKHFRQIEVL